MSSYTPEQIERRANHFEKAGILDIAAMLRDYATLRQQAGRVDEGMVERACAAFDPTGWEVMGGDSRADFKANMRAALTAALAQNTQGDGEPVAWMGMQRNRLSCGPLGWTEAEVRRSPTFDTETDVAVPLYLHAERARVPEFQAGVSEWMSQCFLPSLYSNMTERGDRLLEEVLELLQSTGYDRGRVATLVDYVWGRPVGEPAQEVGGVMVTLAGFCWIAGLNMHEAGDTELARINRPEVMEKIRRKQEAKNALHFDTPLPGSAAAPSQRAEVK